MAVRMTAQAVDEMERQQAAADAIKKSRSLEPEEPPPSLEEFMDVSSPVKVGGKSVVVRPMVMRQVIDFTQVSDPFLPLLMAYVAKQDVPLGQLFDKYGDSFMSSIAVALVYPLKGEDKDKLEKRRRTMFSELEGLPIDQFLTAAGKALLVNVDFFRQRLPRSAALVQAAAEEVRRQVQQ